MYLIWVSQQLWEKVFIFSCIVIINKKLSGLSKVIHVINERTGTLKLGLPMQTSSFPHLGAPIHDVVFMDIDVLAPWGLGCLSSCTRAPWKVYETTLKARFLLWEMLQRYCHLFTKIQVFFKLNYIQFNMEKIKWRKLPQLYKGEIERSNILSPCKEQSEPPKPRSLFNI